MSRVSQRGVVLVGHGGIPVDYPREALTALKTLEAKRRATGGDATPEELTHDSDTASQNPLPEPPRQLEVDPQIGNQAPDDAPVEF